MNEDLARFEDTTSNMRTISVLNQRLQEAAKLLSTWQVEFSVEVDPQLLDIRVTALKPYGGGGVIKTITMDEAIFFSDDIQTMVNSVIEDVYSTLIKKQLFDALHDKLLMATRNVKLMKGK